MNGAIETSREEYDMRCNGQFSRLKSSCLVALACGAIAACSPARGGIDLAPEAPSDDQGAPPPPKARSADSKDGVHGDHVAFTAYPVQQPSKTGSDWGTALTDIAQHLPASYGDTYWDADYMTAGHETTHGINSELRNNWNKTGKKANGFYVLSDRAAIVVEPNIRKSDCAPYIPASLHGSRYDLYIAGQTEWDDTPTYVFDEWIAYTNGGTVATDLVQKGLYKGGWTDAVMGQLEFVVYGVAVAMAVEKGEPAYWSSADGAQFKEFVAFSIKRAMDVYRIGAKMDSFKWDQMDAFYAKMVSSPDAEPWRAFARRVFGEAWADEVIFGTTPPGDVDAGPADTGPGPVDSGPIGTPDSGTPDSGPVDTGVSDSGPPTVDDAGGGGGTPGDEDGDGIPDTVDLCSHTAKGAAVWTSGDWLGCATGQHRDGGGGGSDTDGDGIPDVKDRCGHTPTGMRVWKYGDWIGCGGGEHRDH